MSNLLNGKELYVKSQVANKLIKVTGIFSETKEANQWMDEHPEEGAIDYINGNAILADCNDLGIEPNDKLVVIS